MWIRTLKTGAFQSVDIQIQVQNHVNKPQYVCSCRRNVMSGKHPVWETPVGETTRWGNVLWEKRLSGKRPVEKRPAISAFSSTLTSLCGHTSSGLLPASSRSYIRYAVSGDLFHRLSTNQHIVSPLLTTSAVYLLLAQVCCTPCEQ